jgi:hypothetical protein
MFSENTVSRSLDNDAMCGNFSSLALFLLIDIHIRRNTHNIFVGKSKESSRWDNEIKMDLREIV